MLTVQDLAFDDNRAPQPVSLPGRLLATAENSPVLVKYAALLAGLMVVLAFGVRPALRRANVAVKDTAPAPVKELTNGAVAVAQTVLKPPEPVAIDPERARSQEIFEQVSEHLKREPTQSSRLLQSWIHSD
jgi:flagellar M-ring protein FliF